MSGQEKAEKGRRDFVRWLADSQRNRSIAMPKKFRVDPGWIQSEDLKSSAPFWSFADMRLAYEPRSLVVSADGSQVAVGTKSGDVYVSRWSGDTGTWKDHHVGATEVRTGSRSGVVGTPPGAIRGLLFLDPETLVAGWGDGNFSIISPLTGKSRKVRVVMPEPRPAAGTGPADWQLGVQRISRVVPLFDPRGEPPKQRDLALAVMGRDEVYVLSKKGDTYLPRRQRLESPWKRSMGPPVDAVWDVHGNLWILTSRGFLLEWTKGEVVRQLPEPRHNALFQRLAACEVGLAVLASENVTFLWLEPTQNGRPAVSEKGAVSWFPVPGALDCATCLPYPGTDDPAALCRMPIFREDPVWTVVSTAEPGLRWVGWERSDPAGEEGAPSWPSSAAGKFATPGGESILYLAFGRPAPGAPLYLACGTRGHKLLISSVLDRRKCERELSLQIEWLLQSPRPGTSRRLFRENPGLGWRCLVTQIRHSFGMTRETPKPELLAMNADELLSFTELSDLLGLSARLVKWHQEQKRPAQDLELELTRWILHLLRRANEIGPQAAREVAETLYEQLQSAWNDPDADELMLRSMANFLRKWVIHGHTYGDKRVQLHQVFDYNRTCGRKLDALVYLTRLMRMRSDTLWETSLPSGNWVPAVWGLAADETSGISVTSLADGGICALDAEGSPLAWEMDDACREVSDLVLSEDGLRLMRKDERRFSNLYRHGPYARYLWLHRLGGKGATPSFLLVFCLKGWRQGELRSGKGSPPRVYALRFRPVGKGRGAAARVSALRIEEIAWSYSFSELYGLCKLRMHEEDGRFSVTLLAGTSGSWGSEGNRLPTPFIELLIERGEDGMLTIDPRDPKIQRFVKGERNIVGQVTVVPEAANNRCWSLALSREKTRNGELTWVWGGFQDGSIRGYRLENGCWYEGGRDGDGFPRQRGLKATGPVWRLLTLERPGGKWMLVYGTGDGVVGGLAIDQLETQNLGIPIRFLLHLRGDFPVCGLVDYTDEGREYLASVDQRGVVSLFHLSPASWPEKHPDSREEDRRGYRFDFPGLRVDQFHLELPVRAIVPVRQPDQLPRFLVGTAEARVHQLELRYPFYSARRREVPTLFDSLMGETRGGRSVLSVLPPLRESEPGDAFTQAHRWLRVLAVEDVSLMRFSLWAELRRAGESILSLEEAAPPSEIDRCFGEYEKVVTQLIEESYRRRPFSEDLAMALWEECARVASWMARRVLRVASDDLRGYRANRYLRHYLRLNSRCADLCNRWIGVDQSLQSLVLIDSFTALFDWTALALIASDPPRSRKAQAVRDFLVYGLIQYRLSYPDTLVPFETLRVINAAISRAVVNVAAGVLSPRSFRVRPRPTRGRADLRIGFYDIMTMVGDVWERLSESLSQSDPLTSEITRFFSLSLLLVPDSVLVIGQVISESRLTERGIGLASLIASQARQLQGELGLKASNPDDDLLGRRLKRFEAYISERTDPYLFGGRPAPTADPADRPSEWAFLLQEARETRREKTSSPTKPHEIDLTDTDMLAEQQHVFRAISWLADLSRPSLKELDEDLGAKDMADTVAWLADDDPPLRFYKHSHTFLKRLDATREEIRKIVGLQNSDGKASSVRSQTAILEAVRMCRDCLDKLPSEHLFQPQREHYEQTIRGWRDQLIKQANGAVTVLDIMDRFNRHVYRRSADALMDNIVNLAMQTAPLSYLEGRRGTHLGDESDHSLRNRILRRLESYSLIRGVFEAGEYLVQNTHLAGALLTIARHYTGTLEAPSPLSTTEKVTVSEIRTIAKDVALRTGLYEDGNLNVLGDLNTQVPGTRVVWDLILQEWATNTLKYALQGEYAEEGPETAFLRVDVSNPTDKVFVRLFSNVPYVYSLEGDELAAFVEDPERAEEGLKRYFEPGVRGNYDDEKPGAGMGLFMIRQLAELVSLKVRLFLLRREDWRPEVGHNLQGVPLWPLCLEITY